MEHKINKLTSLYVDITKEINFLHCENKKLKETQLKKNEKNTENLKEDKKIENRKNTFQAEAWQQGETEKFAWQPVKNGITHHLDKPEVGNATFIHNRFEPLADNETRYGVKYDNGSTETANSAKNGQGNYKAHIKVDDKQLAPKMVPGVKPYNKAHIRTISIMSDSMCRSVRAKDLNADMKNCGIQAAECTIHKFPGATARQIGHYSKINIADDDSHGVVIIGGTNSLQFKNGRRSSDQEIVDDIINIGIEAKNAGVTKVFISGIITRRGKYFQSRILNINNILYNMCLQLGFVFVQQNNICLEHLHKDGLHLSYEGTQILKSNILQALY